MIELPVISLARAEQGDEANIADVISRACTETGFFAVRDHGIDRKVLDNAHELSREFLWRPTAEKSALLSENLYVYTGRKGMPADRLVLDHTGQLPFPADKRGIALRDALKTYFAACQTVADRVTELLTVALEPPLDFFATRTGRSDGTLRSACPPGARPEDLHDQGTGEHADTTLISLFTKDGPGLQLRDLSGDWIDVDVPERDWFIVSIGGLMARWSNGAYVATPHRGRLVDRPRPLIVLCKPANGEAVIERFPKFTQERWAAYPSTRHEKFSLQEMDALFGQEEVRS